MANDLSEYMIVIDFNIIVQEFSGFFKPERFKI